MNTTEDRCATTGMVALEFLDGTHNDGLSRTGTENVERIHI